MNKQCIICKKTFIKPENCSIKEWNTVRKFCSRKCKGIHHSNNFTKEKVWNYKGGTLSSTTGYIYISLGRYKRKAQHRFVMEQFIGRELLRSESVHHINGIKTDNRLENLQLLSKVEHCKLHYPKGSKFGINISR